MKIIEALDIDYKIEKCNKVDNFYIAYVYGKKGKYDLVIKYYSNLDFLVK